MSVSVNGCKYNKSISSFNNLLLMQFRLLKTFVSRLSFRVSSECDLTWTTVPLDRRKLASYRWVSKTSK